MYELVEFAHSEVIVAKHADNGLCYAKHWYEKEFLLKVVPMHWLILAKKGLK